MGIPHYVTDREENLVFIERLTSVEVITDTAAGLRDVRFAPATLVRSPSNEPQPTDTSAGSAVTIEALVRGRMKWMIAVAIT